MGEEFKCDICGKSWIGKNAEYKKRGCEMSHDKEIKTQEETKRQEYMTNEGISPKPRGTAAERAAEIRKRKDRSPVSDRKQTWPVPENDGFTYHVFNDNWMHRPDRIQKAINAGYEVVDAQKQNVTVGTNDNGSVIQGVLMRIPTEIYDEYQKELHKQDDETEKQIYGGKFLEKSGDGRYIPKSGIKQQVTNNPM